MEPRPLRVIQLGDRPLRPPVEFPANSKLVAVVVGRSSHFLTGVETCSIFWTAVTDLNRRSVEEFYRRYIERNYRGNIVKWGPLVRPKTAGESRYVFVYRDRSLQEVLLYVVTSSRAREWEITSLGLSRAESRKTIFSVSLSADDLLTERYANKDFVIPIPR
jgi:hypothetical protein